MKKSGFSMITAIIFIILVSVVGVLTLQSSKSTVSFAARAYLKEQVELIMDGARAKALSRWFESGDPIVNSGIMSNAKITENYYYPSNSDRKYLITIEYTKVDSSKALKFDKNTVLARISVETGEALSKVAKIRLVRDYTIGN
ncbi:hypothetical protein AVBRAN12640_01245 [Campylobacter sp. RM12640]|uniref:hypothetical protein n=1 Tax=unclassified Campylobacter TaxID=2593542 RepID=UPI001BDA328E|nr:MULTISPECIES: hypothetical protein [unclassified Campylobacter]MBZ7979520.1 hypothetical protein [Campylobacter sp. RM12642]MBZ7981163.1 hypothetical protein [Campylobacter sp. RM12640]MBZ7988722.1 hypothetical protein [Campylobacter sp. RM12635]MBZ7990406.1 hypothetical protein [Campylobacter sp. RM9331]MBZ7992123.1 hypothetical protein [Campylobacter sp. RM9333]MBZ8005105.1 hypothetical protein [Campylobacter sp. RM9332]MBZ8006925.1 hypothetical protein [Campylobacter sp. RM9334]